MIGVCVLLILGVVLAAAECVAEAAERHGTSAYFERDRVPVECSVVLQAIAAASPAAIVITDIEDRVTAWSASAERMFGWRADEVLGQPYPLIPPDWSAEFRARRNEAFRAPATMRYDTSRMAKDGSLVDVHAVTTSLCGPDGRVVAVLSMLEDISERNRATRAVEEREHLAALLAEASLAITQDAPLSDMLDRCARALVNHLDAAFARVWTLDEASNMLKLRASAGMYTHLDGAHGRIPVGQFKIGRIAAERSPHLSNTVLSDSWVGDPAWAAREGMVAFAGYPLILEGRVLGVIGIFARHELTEVALQAMKSVSNGIALAIHHARTEEQRRGLLSLVDNSSDFIGLATLDGKAQFINAAGREMIGVGAGDDIHGMAIERMHPPEWRQRFEEDAKPSLLAIGRWAGATQLMNVQTGASTDVHTIAFLLHDPQTGNPTHIASVQRDLTEQRQAETAMEWLASFPQMNPDPVVEVDFAGRVTYVNPTAERQLPDLQREGPNHPWLGDWTTVVRALSPSDADTFVRDLAVGDRWFHQAICRVAGTECVRIYGIDITERRNAEEAVRAARDLFRDVVENVPIRVFWKDTQLRYLGCNLAFARDAGVSSPADVIGKSDFDLGWRDQAERYRVDDRQVMEADAPNLLIEEPQTTPDGDTIWLSTSKVPLHDGTQRVIGILGIYDDISERKRVEVQLISETALLDAQLNASIDGILVVSGEGRKILQNKRFAELMKIPADILQDADDKKTLEWVVGRMSDPEGFIARVEYLYAHPDEISHDEIGLVDGTILDRYSAPVIGKDGTRFGRIWTFRDITERKRAEAQIVAAREAAEEAQAELESMNQQLEESISVTTSLAEQSDRTTRQKSAVLAAMPTGLIGIDDRGIVREFSAAGARLFNVASEDVIGRELRACCIDWDWDRVEHAIAECLAEGGVRRLDDLRFGGAESPDELLALTINPVSSPEVEGTGLIVLAEDITARRLMERELYQARRLESIGQLAAGIAHEINTPTQYIGDNLRFLQDAFGELAELQTREEPTPGTLNDDVQYLMAEIPAAIQQSLEGVDRVATIVRAMKEFSHPGTDTKTPTDLNNAIRSTVTVARNEWKYVAEMKLDLAQDLPHVPCLPGEFNQVILNMIVNAAHAIAGVVGGGDQRKGVITISTRTAGDSMEIRITDTGTGIPADIREKVFDPFFTTKEVGKGTGQGLSIARSVIVDKHGGTIHFETEEGSGTSFAIRLPLEMPPEGEAQ